MKTCDVIFMHVTKLYRVFHYDLKYSYISSSAMETSCENLEAFIVQKSFHNKCNYVHPLVCMCLCEGLEKKKRESMQVSDFCALPQNHNKSYSFWHL